MKKDNTMNRIIHFEILANDILLYCKYVEGTLFGLMREDANAK